MRHKDKRHAKLLISLFITFIMISSILGYYYGTSEDTDSYRYNNHIFKKLDNGWITYIGKTPYQLTYDPKSLEDIAFNGNLNLAELNSAQKIYLSFNPEEIPNYIITELQLYLKSLLNPNIFLILSCTEDVSVCKDAVIKTCKNATPNEKIIQITREDKTSIIYSDNCLSINGKDKDLIRTTDRVIWQLLGIMK